MSEPLTENPQGTNEPVFQLRLFYAYLWEAVDSLYPGYVAVFQSPPRFRTRLPTAGVLLNEADAIRKRLVDASELTPALLKQLEQDYSLTNGLIHQYQGLHDEEREDWLKSHQSDRESLLRKTEAYTAKL